jgi:O-antigen/teichoic acid export membrane protein
VRLSDHLGKGIWGAADKGLPVLYGIGYVVLVIRVLPEVELGNFALVQTIFLVVTGLTNGFPLQPLLKFASEERGDKRELVGTAFFLNLLLILAFSVLALATRYVVAGILNAPALENLLLLFPAMLLASFFRNFALVLLQTRYRIQQIFWTDAVHFIGAIVLVYAWSKFNLFDSAYDLVYINLISLGTSSSVGLLFCRGLLAVSWRPNIEYVKLFWDYGKFVLGGILSYLFYSNADYFFISAFAGPAQVGVYNAVKTFVRIYDTMQQVIQMFILPGASRLSSIGDTRSLKVLTEKAICFGTIALLPVFLLFALFAHPLMSAISAGRFADAAPLLQLFGLLSFTTAANAVSSNVLLGLGRAREGFYLGIILLVSSMIFYFVFVPMWGSMGATIGFLASSTLLTWLTVRRVQQFVPFTFREILLRVNDVTQFLKTRLGRA